MSIGSAALRRRIEDLERHTVGLSDIAEAIRMHRIEGREHPNPLAADRAREYWHRVSSLFRDQNAEASAALALSDAVSQTAE
ncbi:MAG: hypothetical protein JNM07_05040 [Phycisphaerae bacterium]|nr:hypothetical protein [Phycisphaerae bacterium]